MLENHSTGYPQIDMLNRAVEANLQSMTTIGKLATRLEPELIEAALEQIRAALEQVQRPIVTP